MQKQKQTLLNKLRKNTISGPEFCEAYSRAMDKHLKSLAKEHLPDTVALIATGGYGRAELCPYSDIDILFLVPQKTTKSLEKSIEKILYALWDSGLKAGHSVRSTGDCINVMNTDTKVVTSLIDRRLVWGNKTLFEELNATIKNHYSPKKINHFVQDKLEERDTRHSRYEDTRYVLEPNIKDGKGGLRDYQTLFWITGMVYGAHTPDELSGHKILNRKEKNRFQKAHDFLTTVRCHLHDIAERGEERLHFDIQPQLAQRLGYASRNNAKAVERFMKHYFLVTRDIGDMTRIVCAAIEEEEDVKHKLIKPAPKSFLGFEILNNRLNFSDDQNLKEQPIEIMRFFRVAQDTDHDIHPKAVRRISRNLDVFDQTFIHNRLANSIFLEILTATENAALTLRRMNECGVLGKFIPDFRKVIALMQFDRYHVFTVDEHTLRAIDTLHKMENGELRDSANLSSALIHSVTERRVLYVAMLLHDICKGRKGDHSMLGAELALQLCPRLGLDDNETRLVSWLVFDHLFMADIAFKRDLEDPKTLEDFLFRVHGLERLKLLTILTTADIIAVGPDRWTNWKGKLIQDLYYMAEASITGKHPMVSLGSIISIPYDMKPDETRIDISQDDEKHATIVSVYTKDKPGLLSVIAGGLSAAEANIIEARIHTLDDGFVADTFTVQNQSKRQITGQKRQDDIHDNILRAVDGTLDIPKTVKQTRKPLKKDKAFDVPSGVIVKNNASRKHNVVEIYGRDRPGLLYDLLTAIQKHGCQINSAKINTLGLKAVDVFYITNQHGRKIKDENVLEKIEKSLLNVFETT